MEYSQELKDTLATAFNEAHRRRHEFVTLEHVLYALLDDPNVKRIIKVCGGNIEELIMAEQHTAVIAGVGPQEGLGAYLSHAAAQRIHGGSSVFFLQGREVPKELRAGRH